MSLGEQRGGEQSRGGTRTGQTGGRSLESPGKEYENLTEFLGDPSDTAGGHSYAEVQEELQQQRYENIHNEGIYIQDDYTTVGEFLNSAGSSQGVKDMRDERCTKPRWRNNESPPLSINTTTIRKDTVMVPAGGYVVINFKSDNPGHWFLHCHIEVHQLEGMALIINEAPDEQAKLQVPDNLNKCGDYIQN